MSTMTWKSNFGIVNVMTSFRSDRREAFVISVGYGMGDPLAPSESEENSGGGRLDRRRRASPVRNPLK